MSNDANETLVIEAIFLLEKAAFNFDILRVMKMVEASKPRFIKFQMSLHYEAGRIVGYEDSALHPVSDFMSSVGLSEADMALFREYVDTIPMNEYSITFEQAENKDGEVHEWIKITQLNYVPHGAEKEAQGIFTQKLVAMSSSSPELGAKLISSLQSLKVV